ncbi:MAG: GNAT family N-acetyltransferase [Chloroflexi bacterium]|nr:GNAT family N-acetyltransferase [Chloroflexota bacterium]
MLATSASRKVPFRGVRRLSLARDLRDVANLIEQTFGQEPDRAGQSVASEFRALAWWGPLLWALDRLSMGGEAFTGFVWEEDGRVVGNVTLSREWAAPGCWLISNVVVAPDYRRRGIARALMEAAMEFVASRRAVCAFLMVRRENQAAIRLYEALGFAELGGQVTLRRESPPRPVAEPPLGLGRLVRDVTFRDGRALADLARAATPAAVQRIQPVQPDAWLSEAQAGSGGWLLNRLGQRSRRCVVEEDGRLLAYARLNIARRKYHRLRFMALPHVRGQVEGALLSRMLNLLADAAALPVLADVGAEETSAIDVLRARGFAESRWLLIMARRLDTAAPRFSEEV